MYLYLGGYSMEYQQLRNQQESTYFSLARNSTCLHSFPLKGEGKNIDYERSVSHRGLTGTSPDQSFDPSTSSGQAPAQDERVGLR